MLHERKCCEVSRINNTIDVKALTKVYNGKVRAVDGISFTVEEGEILGFLGPNGAGKTTTLNILATLLRPTSGSATVNGYSILRDADAVRRSIGYVFQDPTLDLELTGRENLDFHGRLYGLPSNVRKQRMKEMLEVVQLADRADDLVKTYSGGMKRRLEIARGLLHHPKVLFLDEPTLGLDPQTRRSIWEHIQRLNQEKNVTIILTTHYTEEADYLCGRILIIDFGKVVALDNQHNLKARLEGDIVSLAFRDPVAIPKIRPLFEREKWIRRVDVVANGGNRVPTSRVTAGMSIGFGIDGMAGGMSSGGAGGGKKISGHVHKMLAQDPMVETNRPRHDANLKRLNLLVDDGGRRIPMIVKITDKARVALDSVELHKPTLDDVFLSVTGRNIRDERGNLMEMVRRHRIMQQARGRRVPG